MRTILFGRNAKLAILLTLVLSGCIQKIKDSLPKEIWLNTGTRLATVDGFGVNITPAQ